MDEGKIRNHLFQVMEGGFKDVLRDLVEVKARTGVEGGPFFRVPTRFGSALPGSHEAGRVAGGSR